MRIVAFSDTHGNYSVMHKIFKKNGSADLFIFLGDGINEYNMLKKIYIDKKIIGVHGNCDFSGEIPESSTITLPDGKVIFYTHGHKWGVKFSLDKIYNHAKEIGADIVLFGHTHQRYAENRDGILLLNPGSASEPKDSLPASYAWIDIVDGSIVYNHVNV